MSDRLPVVTVAALISGDEGRYLVLRTRKWKGLWGLPAGKVRRGESLEQAVRREVEEETSLRLDRLRPLVVQEIIDSAEFFEPAHFVSHAFLGRAIAGDVRLNHESEEFRWVSRREALELKLNAPTRELFGGLDETSGWVVIDELRFECIVGILPEERVREQPVVISVEVQVDVATPALTGEVRDAVDYADLARRVQALVRERRYRLLETLVEEVASAVLEAPGARRVRVTASKPQAIPGAAAARVRVERGRGSS